MDSFTDLEAWKIGVDLAKEIYRITKKFPKEEVYGMTSQLRRSSTSILANLAEGFGRYTYPDKAAKYTISRGENSETKAFLLVAVALGFVEQSEIQKAIQYSDSVGRLLSGLIQASKNRS